MCVLSMVWLILDVAVMLSLRVGDDKLVILQFRHVLCMYFSVLCFVCNFGLFCFCNLGFEKLA
jgi:hypothetical protein